jgi:hypothetical protein
MGRFPAPSLYFFLLPFVEDAGKVSLHTPTLNTMHVSLLVCSLASHGVSPGVLRLFLVDLASPYRPAHRAAQGVTGRFRCRVPEPP